MRHDERASSDRDPDTGRSKFDDDEFDTFDADVGKGGKVGNHDVDGLLRRLDRLDRHAVAPRRPASSSISSGSFDKTRPDSQGDRLPLFLESAARTVDDDPRPAELDSEWRNAGRSLIGRSQQSAHLPAAEIHDMPPEMYDVPEMGHRSKFPGLALTAGAMMAVAAAIAGLLVFNQDSVKGLGLFASDIRNRVTGMNPAVVERRNNIAGAFATIPNVATTAVEPTSDADATAHAMDRLKQHAGTLALARGNRSPQEAVNSDAVVAPGKSQEGALDVRGSSRANDNVERATAAVPPSAAAPVPSMPSARQIDPVELAALVKRAESLIEVGDIASARLLLERAAEAQDAHAALLLAETYDPAVLGAQDIRSITADPANARRWYEKAAQFGSTEAKQRLAQMQN